MADSLSRALTGSEPFIGKVPLYQQMIKSPVKHNMRYSDASG